MVDKLFAFYGISVADDSDPTDYTHSDYSNLRSERTDEGGAAKPSAPKKR